MSAATRPSGRSNATSASTGPAAGERRSTSAAAARIAATSAEHSIPDMAEAAKSGQAEKKAAKVQAEAAPVARWRREAPTVRETRSAIRLVTRVQPTGSTW